MNATPAGEDGRLLPARFNHWLASHRGRIVLLVIAAGLSLPATLATPGMGIDPSWQLSLQLAVTSIRFNTGSAWAFRVPFKGTLVEYGFTDEAGPKETQGR